MSQACEELHHKWLNQRAPLSQKDTLTSGMFSYISACRKRSINTHQKRICGRQWVRKDNFSMDRHEGKNFVAGSSCEVYGFQSPAKSFELLCYTMVRCIYLLLTLTNSIPRAQWLCPLMLVLPLWGHYSIWVEVRFQRFQISAPPFIRFMGLVRSNWPGSCKPFLLSGTY